MTEAVTDILGKLQIFIMIIVFPQNDKSTRCQVINRVLRHQRRKIFRGHGRKVLHIRRPYDLHQILRIDDLDTNDTERPSGHDQSLQIPAQCHMVVNPGALVTPFVFILHRNHNARHGDRFCKKLHLKLWKQ